MTVSDMEVWFDVIRHISTYHLFEQQNKVLDILLGYLEITLDSPEQNPMDAMIELDWVCATLRAHACILFDQYHSLTPISFWKSTRNQLWLMVLEQKPPTDFPDQDWNDIIILK